MAKCEVCGNDYHMSFEVVAAGARHTFDSFECAIQALAPTCHHCSCRVIGHGVEDNGRIFCCAHCANAAGTAGKAKDRVAEGSEIGNDRGFCCIGRVPGCEYTMTRVWQRRILSPR